MTKQNENDSMMEKLDLKPNLLPIGRQIPKSLCIMDLLQSIIYNPLLWVEGWKKHLLQSKQETKEA